MAEGEENIDDEVSEEPIEEEGENARWGGGVESDLGSGSKGVVDGEMERTSLAIVLGKVNARGVGETMVRIGGGGVSVVTSSSANDKKRFVSTLVLRLFHC